MERDGAGTASVTAQMTEWTLGKQLDWGEEWGGILWWGVKQRGRCGAK